MQLGTKSIERRFEVKVEVMDQLAPLVWDVISKLENDELMVFRPDDKKALDLVLDEDGAEWLDARAQLPISIREWLCVGCQYIRFDDCDPRERLAFYHSNAVAVLWDPHVTDKPAGPGALVADIHILRPTLQFGLDGLTDPGGLHHDKFRGVIAHELVHAFDAMRLLVPAFMDWDAFWVHVLRKGVRCHGVFEHLDGLKRFVDTSKHQLELARLACFWPTHAQQWFDALQQDNE